jgi:hypothetical protein
MRRVSQKDVIADQQALQGFFGYPQENKIGCQKWKLDCAMLGPLKRNHS